MLVFLKLSEFPPSLKAFLAYNSAWDTLLARRLWIIGKLALLLVECK